MSNINSLADVMAAEAELTEQLVEVMRRQQEALVKTDAITVERTTEQQEELLLPIEGLEQERARLTREVWNEIAKQELDDNATVNLSSLVALLREDDRGKISMIGGRLHSAVEKMMSVSQANQYLIEHSRKFVRETFRIVTNDFSRQLIDQKI